MALSDTLKPCEKSIAAKAGADDARKGQIPRASLFLPLVAVQFVLGYHYGRLALRGPGVTHPSNSRSNSAYRCSVRVRFGHSAMSGSMSGLPESGQGWDYL
jgi:hypothetical protein